ncbi:predicted protein [Sclerotinia sclerotiorum 1980 UF-70]|uniref:Uncharacterized protein n=2 Tax=Sclerotinia sclerotiorum (strain ATCC 18683 / 1980 / Ss-1) TaxID=665079 RepID=A7F7A8_SCLS1|nr:predicted protein [Sclerotinia sclerotiorum 1980 UF-70]APA15536.1 hypothetical protein sscle_15g103060 [Sclerotinia sclerotiorum 1980 UF-70]EDN98629.1 predicted protein [Sclerotinia sclerotiorum 1980 UF-70]
MLSKKPGSKLARSVSAVEFTIYATCQLAHIVARDNTYLVLGAPEERRALYILSKDICPVCDGKEGESALSDPEKTLPARHLFVKEKINDLIKSLDDISKNSPNDNKRLEFLDDICHTSQK